jgi:C4-dicarboxylate transporter DctM subunit
LDTERVYSPASPRSFSRSKTRSTPSISSALHSSTAILGFAYRDLKLRDLPGVLFVSLQQSVSLLFIIAAANFFGWLIIHQKIPDRIIAGLVAMGASQAHVLIIMMGIVLMLGCFIEGNAIFLITLPIFMPVARMFGIDLVNFGVVMTLLIMIGNLTPPVGMCLFAVDNFARVGIIPLSREVLPYLAVIFAVTVLIAFVPGISLFLPRLMMGGM